MSLRRVFRGQPRPGWLNIRYSLIYVQFFHAMRVFMRKQQQAFTLIELMVTLAVMAIVMAVAIPSFNRQIQNNRSLAIGETFVTALNYARSEAVKRGNPVTLCASDNEQDGCSTDWSKGWLVVTDTAGVTANNPTVGTVLRVWPAPTENAVISVERMDAGTTTSSDTGFVRYTGLGTLAGVGAGEQVIKISAYAKGCSGDSQQEVFVGVAGLVRASQKQCP